MQPTNSSVELESLKAQLSDRELTLGSEHASLLADLDKIASMCHALSRYEDAEVYYRHSLRIRRYASEINEEELIGNLHRLAVLYRIQLKFHHAEDAYSEALILAEKLYGSSDMKTATHMNYLAGLFTVCGKHEKAERLIMRSVQIYEDNIGEGNFYTGVCYLGLAILHRRDGRMDTANKFYKLASDIVRSDATAGLSTKLIGLAVIYFGKGNYDEADVLLRQALILDEEQLWTYHPLVPVSLTIIGDLCQSQGLYAEAENAYKDSLDKQIRALGLNQLSTLDSLEKLSSFYERRNRLPEAETLRERNVEVCANLLGPDDERTIKSKAKLAALKDRITLNR
jgi:tetratricopeptide (TPR) repeat protein